MIHLIIGFLDLSLVARLSRLSRFVETVTGETVAKPSSKPNKPVIARNKAIANYAWRIIV